MRILTSFAFAMISVIERSELALSLNRAEISLRPCVDAEVKYSTPSAVAIDWAMGVVINPCIKSEEAPGYMVVTVIVALSVRGYSRTGKLNKARRPVKKINKLTTSESTGRRMKRSVKCIILASFRDLAGLLSHPRVCHSRPTYLSARERPAYR